jgi:DNA invertase Pin-like site-specific DNA recombinase
VAENEAKMISERTKAALTAYKARGGVLGAARPDGRRLTPDDGMKGRERSQAVRQANARDAVADLAPMMVELRGAGLSLRAIADRLNEEGHTTRRGAAWNPMQVGRVLDRAGA